ncbi:hypothetical protein DKX38_020365 [Salix brachista]|uniref:Uncharacterized protein n=1 Tax=Salix brachista TaxID=2182728 RepID=A0A5N5K5A0_9ROSI|nr:hypothetical protein DKX38_020365 [Salix brachista]
MIKMQTVISGGDGDLITKLITITNDKGRPSQEEIERTGVMKKLSWMLVLAREFFQYFVLSNGYMQWMQVILLYSCTWHLSHIQTDTVKALIFGKTFMESILFLAKQFAFEEPSVESISGFDKSQLFLRVGCVVQSQPLLSAKPSTLHSPQLSYKYDHSLMRTGEKKSERSIIPRDVPLHVYAFITFALLLPQVIKLLQNKALEFIFKGMQIRKW